MSDVHPVTYNDVIHPTCKKCGVPMALKRLRPSKFDYYNGKFECGTCGYTATAVAKFESVSITPQLPVAGEGELIRNKTPVGT